MGKIATQDELNKLLDSSVDLGRGGGYCPTYSEIMENWKYVPPVVDKITVSLSNIDSYYSPDSDDTYLDAVVNLTKPASVDLEIEIDFGIGGFDDYDYVYIYKGETTGKLSYQGISATYTYQIKIGSILDLDGSSVSDVVSDGKTYYQYASSFRKGVIPVYVDIPNGNVAQFKVTLYPQAINQITVNVTWDEETAVDGWVGTNNGSVIVNAWNNEATSQIFGVSTPGANYFTNPVIESVTPPGNDLAIYEF